MAMCAPVRKRALVRRKVANLEHTVPEDCVSKDIDKFVACVWERIERQELPRMLEDLESLKYVPVKIRKKAAKEPLFLIRYE